MPTRTADPTRPMPAGSHGRPGGYQYWGCRCDRCVAAVRDAQARTRLKRVERPVPSHIHGTANGYDNYCCRCDCCKMAKSAQMKARRTYGPRRRP